MDTQHRACRAAMEVETTQFHGQRSNLRTDGCLSNNHFDLIRLRLERKMIESMDTEQIIAEIEYLERIFTVPDTRALTASDVSAANRRHDEKLARSPWFRLWQRYGVCCRNESPANQPGELKS